MIFIPLAALEIIAQNFRFDQIGRPFDSYRSSGCDHHFFSLFYPSRGQDCFENTLDHGICIPDMFGFQRDNPSNQREAAVGLCGWGGCQNQLLGTVFGHQTSRASRLGERYDGCSGTAFCQMTSGVAYRLRNRHHRILIEPGWRQSRL